VPRTNQAYPPEFRREAIRLVRASDEEHPVPRIAAHVRSLYRKKLDAGLTPRTVQYVHTTLHKALKDAVSDGLVPRNVTEGIKAPRPRKIEVNALSADQARTFLTSARGDRFHALYMLAIHCGLREGELLGLRWDDVDLEAGTLSVRRTLSETKFGHLFEAPKTGRGAVSSSPPGRLTL
jgi:integrase